MKSFFLLLKVKFLGHEIGYNPIKPLHSKVDAIHKLPSPDSKVALICFIGALNFYTNFIKKLHVNLKPFYDLLNENTPRSWFSKHETFFHKVKNALTSDTELTIPNTKHPFFITVDASLIGLGAVLFQLNENNKMKVLSYNSWIPNLQEQKLSTLDRGFVGIVHDLHIQFTYSPIINLCNVGFQKSKSQSTYLLCSNATHKVFQIEHFSYPW